ncbi:hypothetical protein [Corallococcus sicarius]|uniref:Exo-alpha-sialidase n=1 Tax=Corallococcus sicarius TaxID=2316726 RepID=A0A3A8M869_9BACT|nr:hypothetical protein [Corallococcus sicarius]RKH28548.1 hypothetical protein D7X12_40120 [Corallococcus sicarius]
MPAAVSGAALSALLLTGCDPICVDNLTPPDRGHAYMNDAGVCVIVVGPPDGHDAGPGDAGPEDAGTEDAGPTDAGPVEPGCLEPGWTARVLDEGADNAEMAFHFDAKGVGHYAYAKESRLYVGTTKPGDAPRRIDDVVSIQAVRMAVDSLGAHHVLFGQNDWVYYAHDRGGTWQTHALGEGRPAAITFDLWGVLHVLIERPLPDGGAVYVYGIRPGSPTGWTVQLKEVGQTGTREQLVADASNRMHVLFLRTAGGGADDIPVYATDATGGWTAEPLEWAVPLDSPRPRLHLQVDAQGRPHVLGSDAAGAWWWVKDGAQWQRHSLGPLYSHGPALRMGDTGPSHMLLDHDDAAAKTSHLFVRTLAPETDGGSTTPWLPVEASDGGLAFPINTALHTEDGGVVRVGYPYIHYMTTPGTPLPKVTRGLRYARYCP